MRRMFRFIVLAAGLVLAAPVWAAIVSHNGFDFGNLNGTADVSVFLGCEENAGDTARCIKIFDLLGETHVITWASAGTGAQTLVEGVLNATNMPWTDYHYTFQNMDFVGAAPGGLPFPTTFVVSAHSVDLYFPADGLIQPGEGFFITLFFNNFGPDGIGTIEQFPTVPEPATLVLLGSALLGLSLARERFRAR